MANRKAFNFYRSYFEVYMELSDKDKVKFMDALLLRQFTGVKPNLDGMSKFAYLSQSHSIDAQVSGYETKTGIKLTPTEGGSQGATEGATEGGSQQGEGKEEEQGEGKEEEQGEGKDEEELTKPFNFKSSLLRYGFKKQLVTDWLKVRRTKKATNSETAYNKFISQVEKSTLDKNLILEICIERDWKSFNHNWDVGDTGTNKLMQLDEYDFGTLRICEQVPSEMKALCNLLGCTEEDVKREIQSRR